MGNSNLKKSFTIFFSGGFLLMFIHSAILAQAETPSTNLADAFQAAPVNPSGNEEVEPIVVGRKNWNDRPPAINSPLQSSPVKKKCGFPKYPN